MLSNHLLRNPLYVGEIHFKGEVYPGQHKAIVDRDLYELVQLKLRTSATEKLLGQRAREPSLLSGLLRDPAGRKMGPTHGCKKGQRYRYYVTTAGQYDQPEAPFRFPAQAVEQIVIDCLSSWLDDAASQVGSDVEATAAEQSISNAASDSIMLRAVGTSTRREIVLRHVRQIDLSDSILAIQLVAEGADPLTARLGKVRRGNDVQIIVKAADPAPWKPRNEELVHMLADAREVQKLILSKPNQTLAMLAEAAGRSEKIFKRMLRLSYLAPDIAQAILEGNQPASMSCRGMHRIVGIPISWADQRRFFQLD